MFSLALIQENPITKEPALWLYSPRCSLSCKSCILPFRTKDQYSKLDIVQEIKRVRPTISSVVFYLGDMQQPAHILVKYLSVVRSTWRSLARYICFVTPNVRTIWKFVVEEHIDGLIYDIHWPLTLPDQRGEPIPGLMRVTGCSERQFLQSLFVFYALLTDSSAPPYSLRPCYHLSVLKSSKDVSWHKQYFS